MQTVRRCAAPLVAILLASGVAAQTDAYSRATPFVAADHWAVAAMRRLAAAHALPQGFDAGSRALRVAEIARAFDHAADGSAPTAALAGAYRDRFAEEFGAWAGSTGETWSPRLAGSAGYRARDGVVRTGIGYENIDDWTGTAPIPDEAGAAGSLALGATVGRHVAALVAPAYLDGEATVAEAQLVVELGPVGAWAGRRAPGYGVGRGGSIVLGGGAVLDGGGFYLGRPITLPWILRYLGPLRFETFLSRIENGDRITDPWFWGARGAFSPHARLDIGISRASMFGGEGNPAPTNLRNVLLMLVGEHAGSVDRGEFANQLLAADVRWRPPLGALPVELYVEWGLDDSSGGYWRAPAAIAGMHIAALPVAPGMSVGVERTSFAARSFKNTIWYRSWSHRGGWTHDRQPLGHPLAGHGSEWLVYGAADVFAARLRVDARVAFRDRAAENLLAPERIGRSTAFGLDLAVRVASWLDLTAGVAREDGARGWDETRAFTAVRAWLSRAAGPRAPASTTGPAGCPSCAR